MLPAAPESLSPAGGAGEEAPDDDEDEAEAEDPERPGAVGGARSGGGGGAGAGSCGGPGSAFTRRAVTLRVLLKDGLLEPGSGVLSIYYLVSAPQPQPILAGAKRGNRTPECSFATGQAAAWGGETEARSILTFLGRRTLFTKHPVPQRRNAGSERALVLSWLCDLAQPPQVLVSPSVKRDFFPPTWSYEDSVNKVLSSMPATQ